MLTPQEVSSHAFPKAVMGGYNMSAVDEFLDELTDDYTTLFKENAALKAKLKVLVEKVEDYRATEDSMRATLLTAQKMADNIIREAEAKRDVILARAELDVQERVAQLKEEAEINHLRLKTGYQELQDFITAVRDVCQQEMALLERLPALPVEIEKPEESDAVAVDPVADEIGASVMAELEVEATAAQAESMELTAEPAAEEDAADEDEDVKAYPEGNPFAPEDDQKNSRRIDLTELKFGRNYGKD